MWPFKSKPKKPVPPDVVRGNLRAKYDPKLDCWNFVLDSIEYQFNGYEFREEAFDWALEASQTIRKLSAELDREVDKNLEDSTFDFNKTAKEILHVDLTDYSNNKTIRIEYVGDDSWADFGVCVTVENGKITDSFCGD
jgi:hypothetical protein